MFLCMLIGSRSSTGIQREKTATYFVTYFGIAPLSITLFCTIKLMQKYTINLTIILNATIGIK